MPLLLARPPLQPCCSFSLFGPSCTSLCQTLYHLLPVPQGELLPRTVAEVRDLARGASSEASSSTRAISGLNSALTSTSAALELQAHKLSALGHKLQVGGRGLQGKS